MVLYHKWDVKNEFAYVLQFFSLISDNLGSVGGKCSKNIYIQYKWKQYFSFIKDGESSGSQVFWALFLTCPLDNLVLFAFFWSQLSARSLHQTLFGSRVKIWSLANHMKKQNKKRQNANSISEKLKRKGLMFFALFFFHVICKISNFDKGTIKHLAKASSTEMTWTIFEWPLTTNSKVHIFWEGPIILRNLHLRKTYLRWRFPKIFGPSQNIWTLPEN